ncbi:MAG: DUF427 domain-containing protein [Anaerolineae bacterium]
MNPIRPIPPAPNQESVWDYPRPPRLEPTAKHLKVIFNGLTIAETRRALRLLETSHPPSYYFPPEDVRLEYFQAVARRTFCEFKGAASYYTISVNGKTAPNAAWYYLNPSPNYEALTKYIAFYPSLMDACYADGELVRPQEGGFYGGWITSDVVGPFKGSPGTEWW